MPYSDPDEQRKSNREGARRRRAAARAKKTPAILEHVGPTFTTWPMPAGAVKFPLRCSADVLTVCEFVTDIVVRCEVSDLAVVLGKGRTMLAAASIASRSLDAAALEARIDALERQAVPS